MEKSRDEEKNKKFTSTIKNKMFKGYEKVRNKIHNNFVQTDNFQRFSYDNEKIPNFINNLDKEKNYSYEKKNFKSQFKRNNLEKMNNISIQHLSKIKKDDYNNILNKLFFTTTNIFNQKLFKYKRPKINLENNNNITVTSYDIKEKKELLNKLFPDITEINQYSNLPFFSLIKVRSPYKMKLNLNSKKEIKKKFPQEEFLYKISHNNNDEEKINYNFIKNKGIKKGRTMKYFHGVDKFCINNKINEYNFIKKEYLNKKNVKLELDIDNLSKGEKIPQISNKEKHIKILENNIKNIKLIPNQLMNDLEEDVFRFIDDEFDNINENLKNKNKKEENKNSIIIEEQRENEKNANIINLSNQFNLNKTDINEKFIQTSNNYKNISNMKSLFNNTSNTSNFYSTGFKKPQQYPINFYSTQQLKLKEHFNKTHKNTFEERNKINKKGYNSERNFKKKLKEEMIDDNKNILKKKKIMNHGFAFKKECKIRDIIIGNKLKCEFNPIDIKRILKGLKPYSDIKLDDEINIKIENGIVKENEKI